MAECIRIGGADNMARKKYEYVWIDGERHLVERELTYEEREAELNERIRAHNARVGNRAFEIARENGRQLPDSSDIKAAKEAVSKESFRELLFLLASTAGVMLLFFAGCSAIIDWAF